MDELAFLDATAQAELVRKKEVKPIELVDAAIERIERLNPQINAVVTPMYDIARKAANDPLPEGPFTGVPYLLKDLMALYAGVRITLGSAYMKDYIADHDSELVVRLKRAGLIVVGRTSTPEFGLLPTSEAHLFGPTRNPWDATRTPGGSSGGSAAAVAAGMVSMAHGNDGGGSIRIPASCCGLFGLKPTRARNPLGPDLGEMLAGLVSEHAMTRSVRDSAALLDATAGPDLGDPYCAPPPARPFIQEVGAPVGKLRIAFTDKAANGVEVHQDCVDAVRDAAALCRDLGHEVVEATPLIDPELLSQAFMAVYTAGCATSIAGLARLTGRTPTQDQFEPLTWAVHELGSGVSAADYAMAIHHFHDVGRQIAQFMVNYDVMLTPTLAEPPVKLGTFDTPDDPLRGFFRTGLFVPFTPLCNVTGQPAMSVPLHWNTEGLPIGTHFIGRFGDEATLFRLAAQLEEARPWAKRRPPISA